MADLTIHDTQPRVQYAVGGTPQSVFAVPFEFIAGSDVLVYLASSSTPLNYGTDYTVTGTAAGVGYTSGTVTLSAAVASQNVTLVRSSAISRATNFPVSGPFDISQLNLELDRLVMIAQELRDKNVRALTLAVTTGSSVSASLPAPAASALVGWSADALSLTNYILPSGYPASLVMAPVIAAATLAAARSALGLGTDAPAITGLNAAAVDAGKSVVATGAGTYALAGPLAGLSNRVINGDFRIAQRGTSFAAIASGTYGLDRWLYSGANGAIFTMSQAADHPILGANGSSLKMLVTTADAAVAAGDHAHVDHKIEGYNVADLLLGGDVFTLAVWLKSSKTGVHCVALRNQGSDRSFVHECNITAANTWQRFSFPVSMASLTAGGTWNYTNSTGLTLSASLMGGTTFQTAADTWAAGNFLVTANQVNVCDTIGNSLQVGDVMLIPGAAAAAFERRPRALEDLLCKRYYYSQPDTIRGPCSEAVSGSSICTVFLPVPMRVAPTIAGLAVGSASNIGLSTWVHTYAVAAGTSSQFTYTATAEL